MYLENPLCGHPFEALFKKHIRNYVYLTFLIVQLPPKIFQGYLQTPFIHLSVYYL